MNRLYKLLENYLVEDKFDSYLERNRVNSTQAELEASAKRIGWSSLDEWRNAYNTLGIYLPDEYKEAKKHGFQNEKSYLAARAKMWGGRFKDFDEMAEAYSKGFTNKKVLNFAKSKGFNTFSELKKYYLKRGAAGLAILAAIGIGTGAYALNKAKSDAERRANIQ